MKLSQIGGRIEEINHKINDFIAEVQALCAIVCDMGGEILTTQGDTGMLDFVNIAAMAAGSFATTKGIANLLGQKEFSLLFHQGTKNNILISNIENFSIIIIVFDNNSILGVVKQKTTELKDQLKVVFEDIVKGQGIIIKKAKIFEERGPAAQPAAEPAKKEPEKKPEEKPQEKPKDGKKKFDFDSLMVDDLDDLF